MVVSTYWSISLKVVGSTMGVFMGGVYRFKAPKLFFAIQKLNIYKTGQKVMQKPQTKSKTPPICYGYDQARREGVRVYAAPVPGFVAGTRGRLNFQNV